MVARLAVSPSASTSTNSRSPTCVWASSYDFDTDYSDEIPEAIKDVVVGTLRGHQELNRYGRDVFRRRRVPWCGRPNLNPPDE